MIMSLWGCDCPLPALAACHRRRKVCSQLVLFRPLLCARAWQCLRAFRVVAIPQSGLLAQISSLCLPSGALWPDAYSKQCSPHLPAQPLRASGGRRRLHCSAGGVTFGLLICGFYLLIFPPYYVALCASKAQHRLSSESVSWSLETFLFLRFPS